MYRVVEKSKHGKGLGVASRLLRQKAETHLTECERALARNNVDIARNFYASFERALNESTPEFERLRLSPDIKNRMLECKQKVS